MRKEVLFAVFFGTIFGLFVAFGVWRLNTSFSIPSATDSPKTSEKKPNDQLKGLEVVSPKELTVFKNSIIKIEGASAHERVIVSTQSEDYIYKTESDGKFIAEIALTGGLNAISISAAGAQSVKETKSFYAIYSSAFLFDSPDQTAIAYTGHITDISESSINLKSSSDEIKQISVGNEVAFSNDKTRKEIKFQELALGDYIIAMGYKNGNNVLNAKRIVVSSIKNVPQVSIHVGTVKDINKKSLTLLAENDKEIELTLPKSWKGPDIKDIVDEKKAIAITSPENKDSIRTIEVF